MQQFKYALGGECKNGHFQQYTRIQRIALSLTLKHRRNVSYILLCCAFVQLSELSLYVDSGIRNTFLVKAGFGYS